MKTEMLRENKPAFIIIYIWDSTDQWYEGFPSEPHQWYYTEYKNAAPKVFFSRKEAEDLIKDKALYGYKIVCIAGKEKARKVGICGHNGVPYSKSLQESIKRINKDIYNENYDERKDL